MEQQILGTVRASSWSTLFDCAHRWYWQNVMQIRKPSSGAAILGNAIHAGTAYFDTARMHGINPEIGEAVDVAMDYINNPKDEVAWDNKLTIRAAEQIAIVLTTKYCQQIAPYREYVAVELPCDDLIIITQSGAIRLTGSTDRVRKVEDGQLGLSDLKSGALTTEMCLDGIRRAITQGHLFQLGIYKILTENMLQQELTAPGEIIGLQTTNDAYVATGEIPNLKLALIGDEDNVGVIEMAAQMLKAGIFPPNPKSILCTNTYCPAYDGRCKYHD